MSEYSDKLKSIGFTYKHGRESFHGPGIPARRAQAIAEAKAQGNEPRELTRREREAFRDTV